MLIAPLLNAVRDTGKKSRSHEVTKSQDAVAVADADKKNGEAHRATYYIPKSLHRRLKAYASGRGESPSDIVAGLIEDFFAAAEAEEVRTQVPAGK